MKNKIFPTFEEAIADIHDGASIMMFHWGLGRSVPQNLIRALYEKVTRDLTIISHNFTPARLGERYFGTTEVYTPLTLVNQAKKVIVAMTHTNKKGEPKIVRECKLPLTAKECVNLIVTDLAVIEITPQGLLLKEIAPGWTVGEVQALTQPKLIIADDLAEMTL